MKARTQQCNRFRRWHISGAVILFLIAGSVTGVFAQAVPGGTLDPTTIPKYVQPLVIPPVMKNTGTANDYDIAVRQFQQQILPGGHWNAVAPACIADPTLCTLPATTVWSYGPAADSLPDSSGIEGGALGLAPVPLAGGGSQFNYPAFTIENKVNRATTVDWINDLKENFGAGPNYLPHLLPIDQTLHWANPAQDCAMGPARTDCRGKSAVPYKGPVPIITHVHGAHVGPESDGYPEAWYLPDAANIPAGYAREGKLANGYGVTNTSNGVASFTYPNDQPSTTLWYHDHTLGMTRNNVYAGPAGFWLIRRPNGSENGLPAGMVLPGPAPVAGEDPNFGPDRGKFREIPIVIQGRSFNADGSLFYPANRAFFEGLGNGQVPSIPGNFLAGLSINFIGGLIQSGSDISPIWNPEFFANTMVVNGTTWPYLDVAEEQYRLRLLNGSQSRFLNLSLRALDADGIDIGEVPFYQIGAEQSLLPYPVRVRTGFKAIMPEGSSNPIRERRADDPQEALLMGLAERADVIVDFGNLPHGTTTVRMINTAPDAPFGGFPDIPADPGTTGQVMEFRVTPALNDYADSVSGTPVELLRLNRPDGAEWREEATGELQDLALLEEESVDICTFVRPNGRIVQDIFGVPDLANPGTCINRFNSRPRTSVPFAPKAAVLGTSGSAGGAVQLWSDPITTNPAVGETQVWELWNWTVDGHPIHLHLVKFRVLNREVFDPLTGALSGKTEAPEFTERGWKDTVIAYPGEVTRVKATFDIPGLYVWHCHIVEHEDNEMMVPFCVDNGPGCDVADPTL